MFEKKVENDFKDKDYKGWDFRILRVDQSLKTHNTP